MGLAAGNLYVLSGIVITCDEFVSFIKTNKKYQQYLEKEINEECYVGLSKDEIEHCMIFEELLTNCTCHVDTEEFLDDKYDIKVFSYPCHSDLQGQLYILGVSKSVVSIKDAYIEKTKFEGFPEIKDYTLPDNVKQLFPDKQIEYLFMVEDCLTGCS